jgi:CO/xanthine dehydrogenase Mo-binding subunit
MVDGNPWPRIGIRECLEAMRDHPLWKRRSELPPGEGIGVAAAGWPGARSSSGAVCRFDPDGGLTVFTGAVDMSGTATSFAAIAADTFGIPVDQVRVVAGDTSNSPTTPASGGSMVTYSVGGAVQDAAANARKQLLEIAAGELEVDAADLEIADGSVRAVGAPSRSIPLEDLALRFGNPNASTPPIQANGGSAPTAQAPSHAAHIAHVRVDEDTGEIRVLDFALAQDVGTAINPALVEGQMRGGVAQGIGWALLEEYLHDEEGNLLTGSLMNYAVPSAENVPEIDTIIIEVPSAEGPFGAKGMAEGCVLAAPAAIANAVRAATGIRPRELPMTPPRVWAALQASQR